jgi:Tfp pilus assembly PilM family ATPase
LKILALDIGSAYIKTAIFESKFKRFDLVLQDITSVPDAWDPPTVSQGGLSNGQMATLADIRQRFGEGVDRIVTNTPLNMYSSRFQTYPFKDRRKVKSAVQFAIEDEVPFSIDDCVVTSHLYPPKGKESSVLTGIATVASLSKLVEGLTSMGLPPDALQLDEAAYGALFAKAKIQSSFALLDLGHRKSTIFLFRQGLPVLHRSTMVGGYHITLSIAQRYNLGIAEAELAKTERGFVASSAMKDLSADQQAFSECIRSSLEPLLADIQQGLMAFSSRFQEPMPKLFLTGGTSLLSGLKEYLQESFSTEVSQLRPQELLGSGASQETKTDPFLTLAVGLGTSQLSGESRSELNFRSGPLAATHRSLQLNLAQFLFPARLALGIYIVAMISVIGQTILLNRQVSSKEEILLRSLRSALPGSAPTYLLTLRDSPVRLKSAVEGKVLEAQSLVKGGGSKGGALDLILSMSTSVTKDKVLEIRKLEYSPKKLQLTVETPNQAQAEQALESLKKLPLWQSPVGGPLEPAKGERKRFSFTATPSVKGGG